MLFEALKSAEIPSQGSRSVSLGGKRILLIRSSSGLFALEDKCPHQERTLEGGAVKGHSIECPWHSVKIEIATGKVLYDMGFLGLPDVKVFPVHEKDGKIFVDLPQ